MKYTRTYLKKLEELCGELLYKVRYEQGHFQSGYCILETKRVLIINKFFDIEGRINCLLELIPQLPMDQIELTEDHQKLFDKIMAMRISQEDIG
jgi:hypothetical protein